MRLLALAGAALCAAGGATFAQSTGLTTYQGPPVVPSGQGAPNTPSDIVVTQSASQAITPLNSISCNQAGVGHTDNWYFRVFDISGLGGDLEIQSLEIGVEVADAAAGTQPVRFRVYDSADLNDTLIDANIVHESTVNVPDQSGTILSVPVSGTLTSGSMIVEVFTPSGQATNAFFFIGSNAAGQTGPSYIRADSCGIPTPTDLAAIGFPNMHIVMNVNGKLANPPCGNDSCATPDDVGSAFGTFCFDNNGATNDGGGTTGCGSINSDVWFTWTSPVTGNVIAQTCNLTTLDTKMAVYDAGTLCPAGPGELDCNDDTSGCASFSSSISWFATAGNTYLVRIGSFSATTQGSGQWEIFEDPCNNAPDDAFENNDTCDTANPLTNGTYPGLAVKRNTDPDYFSLTVANGATVTVDALFTTADGDIDIFLYDDTAACNAADPVNCVGSLICGFTASDNESISWTNNSGGTKTYVLRVQIWPLDDQNCNTYDLIIGGAANTGPGVNYCASVPNSTGNAAVMSATGSNSVAANDLTLSASPVPNSAYIFFYGTSRIQVPFGNGGFLCVGGSVQRLYPPAFASGNVASRTVLPGATFVPSVDVHFQCWFRDSGGDGFNTSDGYTVKFGN